MNGFLQLTHLSFHLVQDCAKLTFVLVMHFGYIDQALFKLFLVFQIQATLVFKAF